MNFDSLKYISEHVLPNSVNPVNSNHNVNWNVIGQNQNENLPLILKDKRDDSGFGQKTIGFWGGMALLVNNLAGPVVIVLPLMYQTAGWLTPTIGLILVMVLSTIASAFLCEAMSCLPGNENFQGRVEFTTLVSFFFGHRHQYATQVFVIISLQAYNVASIIICSQIMDKLFVALFTMTCGLEVSPTLGWSCVSTTSSSNSPFYPNIMLFTFGYLFMLGVVLPLGFLNLNNNLATQYVAVFFLFASVLVWITTFVQEGMKFSNVPTIGSNQSNVLGTILFNYAIAMTVPSWCNEKKTNVSVNKSLWYSGIISTVCFIFIGILGALAFKIPSNGDLLDVIDKSPYSNVFSRLMAYLFPIASLCTSVPVYAIMMRYNLLQNHICSQRWANFIANILPWILVIPFMTGERIMKMINWGSLIFVSVANFIIPFIIYIAAINFRINPNARITFFSSVVLTENQKKILESISPLDKKVNGINDSMTCRYMPVFRALPKWFPVSSKWVAIISVMILFLSIVTVITCDVVMYFAYNVDLLS